MVATHLSGEFLSDVEYAGLSPSGSHIPIISSFLTGSSLYSFAKKFTLCIALPHLIIH